MRSPLYRKGEKVFSLLFISVLSEQRGGFPSSPTVSEEPRLQPFSSRARTAPRGTARWGMPWHFSLPAATRLPPEHPEALRPVGLQGGDPAVACAQPDTPALPYPHSAVAWRFFQETFKR